MNVDSFKFPDTPIVAEARRIAQRALEPYLFAHTQRAYHLGKEYARRLGIAHDDELLAISFLFHDLGIAPAYRQRGQPFTKLGSAAARRFLEERAYPPERIPAVVDAIDFHMQIAPQWQLGTTAGLLQVGAWMDVTGLRSFRVWPVYREVRRRFPRDGMSWKFSFCILNHMLVPRQALGVLRPTREQPVVPEAQ